MSRRRQARVGAGLALVAVLAGVAVVVTGALEHDGARGGQDPGATGRTALATITQRRLSSQQQVDGKLGYAGAASIGVPSGTAPSLVRKAQQAVAGAVAMRDSARTTLALDRQALVMANARLAGAALGRAAAQARADERMQVASARAKVVADQGQLASAAVAVRGARQDLISAASSALAFEADATFTMLPPVGSVVRRGHALYAIDTTPALLMYGRATAWRAFRPGMTPGRDVAALNANLRALGYPASEGDAFTAATAGAIGDLQAAHGMPRTGRLARGSVAFASGPLRIAGVQATRGSAARPGPVLAVTSTRHRVTLDLDASQQTKVAVGDAVTVTLPDRRTTLGRVSSVGRVAVAASGAGGDGDGTPTIAVGVRLSREAAAGHLDKASVHVAITTASVARALVAPVGALLALAGGGYALETVQAGGGRRLVPVGLGLFDDAQGLVQITGRDVHAGARVVTAAS